MRRTPVLATAAVALLGALAVQETSADEADRSLRNTPALFVTGEPGAAPGLPPSLAGLAEQLARSVVTLEAISESSPRDVYRGTGFVVSQQGYIVTVSALTAYGSQVRAHFPDGSDVPVIPVGQDPSTSLALLEIPPEVRRPTLQPVQLGDSDQARIGEWVMTLVQSDGDVPSLAKGILSAWELPEQGTNGRATPHLQIDIPLVSTYAGGPVVDMRGRLIGMIASPRSPLGGLGRLGAFSLAGGPFTSALPVNQLRGSIERLLARREPPKVQLGVRIQPNLGSDDRVEPPGARVASVIPYSAAAAAKLEAGDLLVEFDGRPIRSYTDLTNSISQTRPGQQVDLVVLRAGERRTLRAAMTTSRTWIPKDDGSWGFEYAALDQELRARLSLAKDTRGIVVTDLDGLGSAARAGLQIGDLVLEANRQRVRSPADLRRALETREPLLRIRRNETTLFVVLVP